MTRKNILPSLWSALAPQRTQNNDPIGMFHRELDRVFDDFLRGSPFSRERETGVLSAWGPQTDVSETDHDIQVTVELPGVDEQDVDVTLWDNTLRIRGEKRAEKKEQEKDYHLTERSYGTFERIIPMPYNLDPESVDAKFSKGVLTVILPKPPEARETAKKIPVKAA